MPEIVLVPPETLVALCDTLTSCIGEVNNCISSIGEIGKYESDVESVNFIKLIIRHLESVILLACHDMVALPSAMIISRSALEAAIRLLWMCSPNDPMDREVRWLAHLHSEEDFYLKLASQKTSMNLDGTDQQRRADEIRSFREGVSQLLPQGYNTISKMPNLWHMLTEIGEKRLYPIYIIGCQYAHSTHNATGMYRKHLGIKKESGEYATVDGWKFSLGTCWHSLKLTCNRVFSIHNSHSSIAVLARLEDVATQALNRLII